MFILSPNLEKYLLVTYIFSLLYIVGLKRDILDGSGLGGGPVHLSAYEFNQDLKKYFLLEQFEKITTVDEIYGFIEKLQTERLWVAGGERSPNWPVGLTRVVQHRVKTPAWCDRREAKKATAAESTDSAALLKSLEEFKKQLEKSSNTNTGGAKSGSTKAGGSRRNLDAQTSGGAPGNTAGSTSGGAEAAAKEAKEKEKKAKEKAEAEKAKNPGAAECDKPPAGMSTE